MSPVSAAFEIARVRQKPPRWMTYPKTKPVESAETYRSHGKSSTRAC